MEVEIGRNFELLPAYARLIESLFLYYISPNNVKSQMRSLMDNLCENKSYDSSKNNLYLNKTTGYEQHFIVSCLSEA